MCLLEVYCSGGISISDAEEELDLNEFGNGLILLILMLLAIGLALTLHKDYVPAESFLEGIIAGLVGTFIGIIVATFIADKYIRAYEMGSREREWSMVRAVVCEAIIDDLFLIALKIYILLPISGLMYRYSHDPSAIKEFNKDILEKLPHEFEELVKIVPKIISSGEVDIDHGSGKGLTIGRDDLIRIITTTEEDIRPVLNGIKYIRIQRVIQSSSDQEIINALIKFEKMIDIYYYNLQWFHKENLESTSSPQVIMSMKILIDSMLELYSKIAPIVNGPSDRHKKNSESQSSNNESAHNCSISPMDKSDLEIPWMVMIVIFMALLVIIVLFWPFHAA